VLLLKNFTMKKIILPIAILALSLYLLNNFSSDNRASSIDAIKKKHKQNIDNNPFKETLKLSKSE